MRVAAEPELLWCRGMEHKSMQQVTPVGTSLRLSCIAATLRECDAFWERTQIVPVRVKQTRYL